MTDDRTLIEALRAAGHDEAADSVRDRALADQLREAGHDALAETLTSGTTPSAVDNHEPGTPAAAAALIARGYENGDRGTV